MPPPPAPAVGWPSGRARAPDRAIPPPAIPRRGNAAHRPPPATAWHHQPSPRSAAATDQCPMPPIRGHRASLRLDRPPPCAARAKALLLPPTSRGWRPGLPPPPFPPSRRRIHAPGPAPNLHPAPGRAGHIRFPRAHAAARLERSPAMRYAA